MAQPVRLVCALRNPDPRYAATRHNAGDWWIVLLARRIGTEFASRSRLCAAVAKFPGAPPLCRSLVCMNDSGRMVAAVAAFFKSEPASVLVAHDEIDLPPGAVRLKFGGGLAGHNGLRDVSRALGTGGFWRLRLGVGRPAHAGQDVVGHVLGRPAAHELDEIEDAISKALDVWPEIVSGDMNAAMRELHNGAAVRPS